MEKESRKIRRSPPGRQADDTTALHGAVRASDDSTGAGRAPRQPNDPCGRQPERPVGHPRTIVRRKSVRLSRERTVQRARRSPSTVRAVRANGCRITGSIPSMRRAERITRQIEAGHRRAGMPETGIRAPEAGANAPPQSPGGGRFVCPSRRAGGSRPTGRSSGADATARMAETIYEKTKRPKPRL